MKRRTVTVPSKPGCKVRKLSWKRTVSMAKVELCLVTQTELDPVQQGKPEEQDPLKVPGEKRVKTPAL